MHTTKIATCCYCGARTVLQLTTRDGHELACASCGAPVHEMKPLKAKSSEKSRGKSAKRRPHSGEYIPEVHGPSPFAVRQPDRRKKRRKSRFWDLVEDVVDGIEDILD